MNINNTNVKAEKKFIIFDRKDKAYVLQAGKTAQKALDAYLSAHPSSAIASGETFCVYKVGNPTKFVVNNVITRNYRQE